MTTLRVLIAAACLMAAAAPAEADWAFGLFGGASFTQPAVLNISRPAFNTELRLQPVHLAAEPFEPPIYYGYRARVSPRSWKGLGVEAEFVHFKVIADTLRVVSMSGTRNGAAVAQSLPMREIVERFSISHGVNLVMLNGVYRFPARRSGSVVVLARAGAGPTVPHPESMIEGVSQEAYEMGAVAVQASAGAELRIRGRLYAAADVKWSRTVQRVSIPDGIARIPLNTAHITFGLSLRLG